MEASQKLSPTSGNTSGNAAGNNGSASTRAMRATLSSWLPESQAEKATILAQLELLLAHPLFSQSKRYPALLRFVVEQTIQGNAEQVKERCIGIEVFGRPPGYDANGDPIVRVTAGEIRKRLAQYYYDPAHADEPRIELPTGSYVPIFQRPTPPESLPSVLPATIQVPLTVGLPGTNLASTDLPSSNPPSSNPPMSHRQAIELPPAPQSATISSPRHPLQHAQQQGSAPHFLQHPTSAKPAPHHRNHPYLTLLLVLLSLGLGLTAGYEYRRAKGPIAIPNTVSPDNQALEDFWRPLTDGPATVTFCLGEPARNSGNDANPEATPTTDSAQAAAKRQQLTVPLYFRLRQSGLFALADTITLTRLAEPLQKRNKSYRIAAASEAGFSQLREGPAVLIGAFDNLWSMRLTRDLRFGFDSTDGNAFIVDRKTDHKNPNKTTWSTAWDLPYEKLARDYAIVARLRDSTTGQPLVIAAGISEEGTEAAGEILTNPAYLANLLRDAPPNWRSMNMEAVIETQVIDGHAGPPQMRAVEFW